jgi:DNA-binding transcriptional MocR family regulator
LAIFIKLKNINARQLLEKCYEDGVVFLPGDIFFVDGSGSDTLRLGFSRVNSKDMERGLQIIGKNIKKLQEDKT